MNLYPPPPPPSTRLLGMQRILYNTNPRSLRDTQRSERETVHFQLPGIKGRYDDYMPSCAELKPYFKRPQEKDFAAFDSGEEKKAVRKSLSADAITFVGSNWRAL